MNGALFFMRKYFLPLYYVDPFNNVIIKTEGVS